MVLHRLFVRLQHFQRFYFLKNTLSFSFSWYSTSSELYIYASFLTFSIHLIIVLLLQVRHMFGLLCLWLWRDVSGVKPLWEFHDIFQKTVPSEIFFKYCQCVSVQSFDRPVQWYSVSLQSLDIPVQWDSVIVQSLDRPAQSDSVEAEHSHSTFKYSQISSPYSHLRFHYSHLTSQNSQIPSQYSRFTVHPMISHFFIILPLHVSRQSIEIHVQ